MYDCMKGTRSQVLTDSNYLCIDEAELLIPFIQYIGTLTDPSAFKDWATCYNAFNLQNSFGYQLMLLGFWSSQWWTTAL